MPPEVSVVIPTYNRAHLLPRTISSVLNQSYKDFEVIVVDDCSTDNTQAVVSGINDNRLRYIRLPENSGWSSRPRNTGLLAARGKYIAFMDSDDEWLPPFLARLIDKMRKSPNTVGLVYCGLIVRHSNNNRTHVVHYRQRGMVYPSSLEVIVCSMTTSLVRRECFDKVGLFDQENNSFDHWDMIIRLSKEFEFDYIPEALAIYNCHDNQRSIRNRGAKMRAIQTRYAADYAAHPKQAGTVRLKIGLEYARDGRRREAIRYILPNLIYGGRVAKDFWCTHRSQTGNGLRVALDTLLEVLVGRRR